MGFTPGKSTVTALILSFHNNIEVTRTIGSDVGLVFFDLRKAFDSVPHLPLVQRLWELGLNCHILQWITNYLYCRRQYVVVNDVCSPTTPFMSGVPQGGLACRSLPANMLTSAEGMEAHNISSGLLYTVQLSELNRCLYTYSAGQILE